MAKGTPPKINRNKKIVEFKAKMTFKKLAGMFNICESRVKQIYYRDKKRYQKGNPSS